MSVDVVELLRLLDSLARRTAMYVAPVNADTVESYLNGLIRGLRVSGFDVSVDACQRAARARGWSGDATGVVGEMRSRQFDEVAIVQEIIAVTADSIRLAAADRQPS